MYDSISIVNIYGEHLLNHFNSNLLLYKIVDPSFIGEQIECINNEIPIIVLLMIFGTLE